MITIKEETLILKQDGENLRKIIVEALEIR
jgi:hypothetical protein